MKRVLFFGDSNTYGYDPAGFMGGRYPRASRWTTILQENLADSWEVLDDGMPGRSLPVGRYEWSYLSGLIRRTMPLDLFAVMLGTNDLLGTVYPDAETVVRRMNDFISFVQKTAKEVSKEVSEEDSQQSLQILLIAPPRIVLTEQSYAEPYVSGDRSIAQLYYEEGRRLSMYYRATAQIRKLLFADASKWDLSFAFDGVHLSEAGHAVFAAEMTKVFQSF